jgi:hypothetical protein
VTLRARWVTLRARWVTLSARWVTLRARWVTLRAPGVTLRAQHRGTRANCDTLSSCEPTSETHVQGPPWVKTVILEQAEPELAVLLHTAGAAFPPHGMTPFPHPPGPPHAPAAAAAAAAVAVPGAVHVVRVRIVRIDVMLIIKLMAVLLVLNQEGSRTRLVGYRNPRSGFPL